MDGRGLSRRPAGLLTRVGVGGEGVGMKALLRILALATLATIVSVAMAIGFDESGFDFSDDGLDTAYVALTTNADTGLTILVSSAELPGFIATVDVGDQIPGFDTDEFSEVSYYRGRTDWSARLMDDVSLVQANRQVRQVSLTFADQPLDTIEGTLMARLTQLGYTVVDTGGTANIHIFVLNSGDENVRMVLYRTGPTTRLTFTAL